MGQNTMRKQVKSQKIQELLNLLFHIKGTQMHGLFTLFISLPGDRLSDMKTRSRGEPARPAPSKRHKIWDYVTDCTFKAAICDVNKEARKKVVFLCYCPRRTKNHQRTSRGKGKADCHLNSKSCT